MGFEFLWMFVALSAVFIEMLTAGLVCIWFALGATVAMIVAGLGFGIVEQIAVFALVSVLGLLLAEKVFGFRFGKDGTPATKEDTLIQEGEVCIVESPVNPIDFTGRVRAANGMTWSAKTLSSACVPIGAKVRVFHVDSIHLIVERI